MDARNDSIGRRVALRYAIEGLRAAGNDARADALQAELDALRAPAAETPEVRGWAIQANRRPGVAHSSRELPTFALSDRLGIRDASGAATIAAHVIGIRSGETWTLTILSPDAIVTTYTVYVRYGEDWPVLSVGTRTLGDVYRFNPERWSTGRWHVVAAESPTGALRTFGPYATLDVATAAASTLRETPAGDDPYATLNALADA